MSENNIDNELIKNNIDKNNLINNEIKLASLYTSYLGIFIFPDKNYSNKIHGFMKLEDCYYSNAIFKFILNIPINFPESIPNIKFVSKIYHPLINYETGEVDINILFPNWNLIKGQQLMDILIKLKGLFLDKELFEIDNSFNKEASNLFKDNINEFLSKSMEYSVKSQEEFGNHYENCPYAFDKIRKIPEELKKILEENNSNKENKIKKIKDFILEEIRNEKSDEK